MGTTPLTDMIDRPDVQRLLQPEQLSTYLAGRWPTVSSTVVAPTPPEGHATSAALGAYRVRGGHSNETFFIWSGSERAVLRRPPLGEYLPTAHDVAREWRVISALAGTNVPVPQPILFCDDVNVIGAPFYLMREVSGVVLRNRLPEWADTDETRRAFGLRLVDALAAIHGVDWCRIGLDGFGKPEGYLERQVRRWTTQLEGARTRAIPDLDAVTAWLSSHIPASPPATIVHGDFRLDNVIFDDGPPVRIAAILDWEMSTLGDPLADLGYLLAFWRDPDDPPSSLTVVQSLSLTQSPGFPSRAELSARYAEQTGRVIAPEAMAFYHALAIWKMAILLEGSYKRHLAGATDDPFFAELAHGIPELAAAAHHIIREAGK